MSWGKKDERLSKMLYENGLFLDKRSRVVYDPEMKPHLKLKGEDVSAQRERLTQRTPYPYRCGICKKDLIGIGYAEMDHRQGGLVGRCDCQHNLQFVHESCHRTGPNAKHIKPQLHSIPMEQVP